MTHPEIAAAAVSIDRCYEGYAATLRQLEADWSRKLGISIEEAKGIGRKQILEAQVRAAILDPLLRVLGWQPTTLVIEDGVEPLAEDSTRRYLDYHGRDQHVDGGAGSLLIVEAKRASVQLPHEDDPDESKVAIIEAITQINGRKNVTVVNSDWAERLSTLINYAKRVESESGALPKVAVLTNGEWFVVFDRVIDGLMSDAPPTVAITVYKDKNAVINCCEEFYNSLSYESLSDVLPVQHPDRLQHFLPAPGTKVEAFFAPDLSYSSFGEFPDQQPALAVRVSARVRLPNGNWAIFRLGNDRPYVELHQDSGLDVEEISKRAAELLEKLRQHAEIELLSPAEAARRYPPEKLPSLCKGKDLKHYQLVTGETPFITNDEVRWDACPYHDYVACRKEGSSFPDTQIYASSIDPRIFYPSSHKLHCAHRAVHEQRIRAKCLITEFEQALCCRRCTFFTTCYPKPDDVPFPCKHS